MIVGVGTDIVAVARFVRLIERHGVRAPDRFLVEEEREQYRQSAAPARFLARRFAAKEAFAKALGLGLRPPATLRALAVAHDQAGRPDFRFRPELDDWMRARGWRAHLSISDEADYAIAFVVVEPMPEIQP